MAYPVILRPAKSHGSRNMIIPKMIVLHHTAGGGNVENEVSYLQSNSAGVSIHVCIAKDGTRYRMVDDERVAYHVGYSKTSLGNPNHVSLGIELINKGKRTPPFDDYPDAQVESCAEQVVEWMKKYEIHAHLERKKQNLLTKLFLNFNTKKKTLNLKLHQLILLILWVAINFGFSTPKQGNSVYTILSTILGLQ